MTDQEIIKGLIARDNHITEEFLFVKCQPLFYRTMRLIFDHEVNYNELVNELYLYLMEDDAIKLRNFQFRSTVYQWLKVLSIRYFIKKRAKLDDRKRQETPHSVEEKDVLAPGTARYDLERLFQAMPSKRYVYVIRRLVLEGCEPEKLAHEMNITTANLYNIKRRSMAQLIRIALNDIRKYGK